MVDMHSQIELKATLSSIENSSMRSTSSFIKSELDFGTVTWSAWGARLLSEFGYGTIATTSGGDDTRRMELLDNNPAGHSARAVSISDLWIISSLLPFA